MRQPEGGFDVQLVRTRSRYLTSHLSRMDAPSLDRALAPVVLQAPKVDTKRIEGQLVRLRELFLMGDIIREEYVGRKRGLEASLESGPEQPTYAEAILVQAARLLNDLGQLWARATADERTEITQNLFASVRVRDGVIVSATLARDEYLPLIASAEARVWMARPEGFEPPTY